MRNVSTFLLVVAAAAFAAGLSVPSPANAAFILSFESGGAATEVDVTDNGLLDLNSTAGAILYSGSIGGYTINIDSGLSAPPLGVPAGEFADMDLSVTASYNGTGATDLVLLLQNDGFTGPTTPLVFNGSLNVNNAGITTTGQAWVNTNNQSPQDVASSPWLPSPTLPAGSVALFAPVPAPITSGVDASSVGFNNSAGTYAMFELVDLSGTSGTSGSASVDFHIWTTPEPTSLGIWGLGLLGMAYGVRRRKKAEV